jgi:hypothetical protein
MTYTSIIKEGVITVHKNWQLIIIQMLFMILSFVSFFLIVGVPVAIAFIIFGLDLTELLRLKDVFSAFKGTSELLSKYFGIAVFIIFSLLLYLAFITVLWVFAFGATISMLVKTILDESHRFNLREFFAEGKKKFIPVFVFSLIICIIFMFLTFILGMLGDGASRIIEIAKTHEATLALFLGIFFFLVLLSAGVLLIFIALAITFYGLGYMLFNRLKPLESLKATAKYLYSRPSSMGFLAVLMLGYILIGAFVFLIGSPLTLIPFIGTILSLPYQLIAQLAHGYVSLIMLSSVFYYYYRTACLPAPQESTIGSGTSQKITGEQAPVPEAKDETQQT